MSPQMAQIPMEPADVELQGRLKAFCDLLGDAEAWAQTYEDEGFAAPLIRNIRRESDRAYRASQRRLCLGLFGPSGAGKSFLIGGLARGAERELRITRAGSRGEPVAFLEHVNPNHADEATAVVCRLTADPQVLPERRGAFVARVLSQADILKCLATGFRYECSYPDIGDALVDRLDGIFAQVPQGKGDDPFVEMLEDAWQYVEKNYIRNPYFFALLRRGRIIDRIGHVGGPLTPPQQLCLASTLWGMGDMPAIDMLYDHLITALAKLGAVEYIEVDQDTVISMGADDDVPAGQRTIVDAQILNTLLQHTSGETTVYAGRGAANAVVMDKATVSALIAELLLPIERTAGDEQHAIADVADILDFPGARVGREDLGTESLQNDADGLDNVVEVLKRGKLTYLFEGYCHEREISVLAFCLDASERLECHSVTEQIRRWITTRYPAFETLAEEEVRSPSLFLCLTKFDKMLSPTGGVGSEGWWDSTIEKIDSFFAHGAERPWFTNWGKRGHCFDNLYWVRNPAFAINPSRLDELRKYYQVSGAISRHMRGHELKWDAVAPDKSLDAANTGIALLNQSIVQKLQPEIKRLELSNQLHVLSGRLQDVLAKYYVSVGADARTEAARKAAHHLAALMRKRETDCVYGPLLSSLGLPVHLVYRQLSNMTQGVVPVLTDQQVQGFVADLIKDWLEHVRGHLDNNGFAQMLSEDPTAVGRFAAELARRAKQPDFHEDFCNSIRFFFVHPLGLDHFRQPLAAICCRKWSDYVTTLGYPLAKTPTPDLPPKLTRDVPWRRYMKHWDANLERLYVDNCTEVVDVPEGNDQLGDVLATVATIVS